MGVLSGELFDAIEVDAVRTGNHKRAAVRMSRLAEQASDEGISPAEAHMRAGEQWLLAGELAEAADEFRSALALGGATFADPRIQLARALFGLGARDEATAIIGQLADEGRTDPRTCDMVAELLVEQGDLRAALDWATAGVDACVRTGSEECREELPLLLRLRYRLRLDLGLGEDDYDRMLDRGPARRLPGQLHHPGQFHPGQQ
ncbi:MAG TPA: tetratricopeptide repeat protein [Streptosporangiaceae bacterium]|nr:tetratricopeptide repeat protein [Streptosporangiaceae bacterium]